ncbi:DUF389 domain-containing protein [Pontixanthobacter gangjinensis]|nr:DUF389 domain-containing protein [Pontixanthobacter gangjinensis]
MASEAPGSTDLSFARAIVGWRIWWRDSVLGTVDQSAVIEKRRAECNLSARYLFMTAMSGGIAILGLLLSSPAVVIGAMLLSPLMDPIMGLGFALATGDYKWLRKSAKSLAWGTVMAVGLCALVVFLSPLKEITTEIAARTRPNLFDLLVALFSALAGAYAMIRGREGTIVGVAIATALMPPLAVVGFGLATFNWTVFSGALLLYVTNLMTIALTAALMARLYGFRTTLSDRQTQLQTLVIVVAFVGLAVPLGLTLIKIGQEANGARQVRAEIMNNFDAKSRLSAMEINWDAEPISIDATVFTPRLIPDAEERSSRALARGLGSPVNLVITQYQVGTSASAAEEAQLANARAAEEAAAAERAADLSKRLALVAGVEVKDVMVDRQNRRAMVKAKALEGATLAAYAELEGRIAATEPEWKIELVPPPRALPSVGFDDGEPSEAGQAAIKLIAWAAKRVDAPVKLSGPTEQVKRTRTLLLELGLADVQVVDGTTGGNNVTARWGAPGS